MSSHVETYRYLKRFQGMDMLDKFYVTNWQVGMRIKEDVLNNERAEYGKQVIKRLAIKLTEKYGKGWSYYKLQHCVRSAYTFTHDEIVYAVRTQLTWTHLRSLMGVEDPLARQFYAEMCAVEHWDTRTLDDKIDKNLYLRTALSRKPENVIRHEQLMPKMFKHVSWENIKADILKAVDGYKGR